jgi:hypothetical protein
MSCLGKLIRVTASHWDLITQRKHPEMQGREHEVIMTLQNADVIRCSQDDPDVFLYYRRFGRYYLCIVCRHLNGDGFVVTGYLTDRIKRGNELWRK